MAGNHGLPSRRSVAAGLAGLTLAVGPVGAQSQVAESFEATLARLTAGRAPRQDGIHIEMAQLSENGNSVDLAIRIDSPMTADDHVRAIHILAEKNPYPLVASVTLGARAGRAEFATRIRLSTTQMVVVLAETSRGALIGAQREVIVILGACVDGG